MSDGGHETSKGVPPSPADVMLPPYARRLDVRATRAAFAAGTLGTVGDDAASGDRERDAVARDADRDYPDDVQHREQSPFVELARPLLAAGFKRDCERLAAKQREVARLGRLARWQRVDPRERRA